MPTSRVSDQVPPKSPENPTPAQAFLPLLHRLVDGGHAFHVAAGAEPAPGPGQEDSAHRRVRAQAGQGVAQRGDHLLAERVQPVGTVQCQHGHAVLDGLQQIGHLMHPPT